jgi:hypothetical protein
MINLIPPEARARIATEYWVRVVTVWLFMIAIAAVVVAASFLPAFVLVTSQVSNYSAAVAEVEKREAAGDTTARPLVVASEHARLIIEAERAGLLVPLVDMIDAIGSRAGVTIEQYQIERMATSVAPVRISGGAPSRAALVAFRDALLGTPTVASIDLPISSFAKDRDIDFSMTVTLAPNQSTTP